jgi:hypothetical protein
VDKRISRPGADLGLATSLSFLSVASLFSCIICGISPLNPHIDSRCSASIRIGGSNE